MQIIKRNGAKEPFKISKIKIAVQKCCTENNFKDGVKEYLDSFIFRFPEDIHSSREIAVEDIQDWIVFDLENNLSPEIAKAYQEYRDKHAKIRDAKYNKRFYDTILELVNGEDNDTSQENANKDPKQSYVIRDLIAGETSKKFFNEFLVSEKMQELENKGIAHIHDKDYRINPAMTNCCLVNIKDILMNGTVINDKKIESPNSLRTAATITTQVSLAVANTEYGGQTVELAALAPFIERSKDRYRKMYQNILNGDKLEQVIEASIKKEIKDSIQILNYQWNSFTSTNG